MMGMRGTVRAQALMAARFEESGNRILFRSTPRAAPVVVTAEERDEEVRAFGRAIGRLQWCVVIGTVVGMFMLALLLPNASEDEWTIAAFVVAIVGFFTSLYLQAWRRPARRFEGRTIGGVSRTPHEVRVSALARIGWRELGISAVSIVFLIATQATRHDLLHGWSRLWLVGGGVVLAGLGWRAVQKLQLNS